LLVLTRKKGEKIRINDDIIIEILEVNSGTIKLGFTAPSNVKIYRDELYTKIVDENRSAKSIKSDDLKTLLEVFKK